MAVKIRLRQQGRINRPFFRVVVADKRSPRDGKYIESVGWYNPFETEMTKLVHLDSDRIKYWIDQGAEVSETVESLMTKGAPDALRHVQEKSLAQHSKIVAKRKAKKARPQDS